MNKCVGGINYIRDKEYPCIMFTSTPYAPSVSYAPDRDYYSNCK